MKEPILLFKNSKGGEPGSVVHFSWGGNLYSPIVDWLVTVTMPTIDKSSKNKIIIKRSSDVTCTELYHPAYHTAIIANLLGTKSKLSLLD